MELEHSKEVFSWGSGGNVIPDFIELRDDRILAISDEVTVLYKNTEDLMTGEASEKRSSLILF